MLGLGWGEIMVILLVALVVVGPEKLPEVARGIGRFMRQVRRMSTEAQEQLRSAVDLDVTDLNPFSSIMDPSAPASPVAAPAPPVDPPPAVDLGPPGRHAPSASQPGAPLAPAVDLGPPGSNGHTPGR